MQCTAHTVHHPKTEGFSGFLGKLVYLAIFATITLITGQILLHQKISFGLRSIKHADVLSEYFFIDFCAQM